MLSFHSSPLARRRGIPSARSSDALNTLAAAGCPSAQHRRRTGPNPPATAPDRAALVPAGWQIEAEASGDLDADGFADLALVLAHAGVDLSENAEALVGPRLLVVGFGTATGYERILTNRQLIPPADDPYISDIFDASSDGLRITDGNLVLDLNFFASVGSWNMWTKTYTFHWQDGVFMLALFDWSDILRNSGKTTYTIADYDAHTVEIFHGNTANEVQVAQTEDLPAIGIVTLDDIADGMAFQP